MESDRPIHGAFSAEPDGTVAGWCHDAADPGPRDVVLLIGGVPVATLRCDGAMPDWAGAEQPDGARGFQVRLPAAIAVPGRRAVLQLRDRGTGRQIAGDVPVEWAERDDAADGGVRGNLDRVTPDGRVSGWAWRPDQPADHVEVVLLADGIPAVTTIADGFRPDLAQAGIGDGTHGFSAVLPWSTLINRTRLTVEARDARSREALGPPIAVRLSGPRPVEERIEALEREIRFLRAILEQTQAEQRSRAQEADLRPVFATFAEYFHRLSQAPAGSTGEPELRLRGVLGEVTERLAPIELARPVAPAATIVIRASADLPTVHGCVAAVRQAGLDRQADILVMDDGRFAEMMLLPSIVRDVRYQRLAPGVTLNDGHALGEAMNGALLVLLSPYARPVAGWLDAVTETFTREERAAIVGSRVMRPDGLLEHGGFLLEAGPRLHDLGRLLLPAESEANFLRPVDAVADIAVAVRRDVLRQLGGWPVAYESSAFALLDVCVHARLAGWTVMMQPAATVIRDAPVSVADEFPDLTAASIDADLLLRRWPDLRGGAVGPSCFVGHALCEGARDGGTTEALRQLGWRVTVAGVAAADGQALARSGIEPVEEDLFTFLERAGAMIDLLVMSGAADADVVARARGLTPEAKVLRGPMPGLDEMRAVLAGLGLPAR